ncbi:gamma-glutamylcyclotransferase family protein [Pseudaestuariivita rosea]|uniref:gamma-glutamylcyclotransferase family protein n=1 Tax=Pseudaestuariivita rosea TaxID=2763263 RepID=UPI001ABACE05|nr:gamma-glutamylcyclotransferase family protein [Pseudaestuariivita rosea]
MRDSFFGYGSLVNGSTHNYPETTATQVTGWRRAWRRAEGRPVSFLTVVPDPNTVIEGLVATVPGGNWTALDAREASYTRATAKTNCAREVAIYTIEDGSHTAPCDDHPILLSYVDVVVQGFLREFGEAGVDRFIETTSGWNGPILNDRPAPRYPRHQTLSQTERALVDDRLTALGARILQHSTP